MKLKRQYAIVNGRGYIENTYDTRFAAAKEIDWYRAVEASDGPYRIDRVTVRDPGIERIVKAAEQLVDRTRYQLGLYEEEVALKKAVDAYRKKKKQGA